MNDACQATLMAMPFWPVYLACFGATLICVALGMFLERYRATHTTPIRDLHA